MAALYATTAELTERFENVEAVALLTNETNGVPDDAFLVTMIERANGIIHSRLAKRDDRYTLPLDVTVALTETWARTITLDLAEVLLLRNGNRVSEAKEKQWDAAIEELDAIAAGDLEVPGVDPGSVDDPTPSISTGTRDSTADVGDDVLIINRAAWSGW